MPINLPEHSKAKWAAAQAAKDPSTKMRLLREFYSSFPKHKGTERLQVALKRQIKRLEEELERARSHRTGSARLAWGVKKEGLLQLAVVGTLATACHFFVQATGLPVEVHEALERPVVGVVEGAGVQLQLVLTPFDMGIGEEKQDRFLALMRAADGLLIVVGFEPDQYVTDLTMWFERHSIDVLSDRPRVELVLTPAGGLRITGTAPHIDERVLRAYLAGYNVRNAVVRLGYDATLDDVESVIFGREHKPGVFVALPGRTLEAWPKVWPRPVSLADGFERLALHVLQRLGLIRVYTKGFGQAPVVRPLVVPRGERVIDVAARIHKDLAAFFSQAQIWRGGGKAIRVGRNFGLQDGDVVEIRVS